MVALRIFQLKHKEVGVFIHHLPGPLLRAASVGIYAWAFPAPSSSLWGCVPVSIGGSRCVLDSSATVSMGKIFPSLTSYLAPMTGVIRLAINHTAW